MGMKEANSFHVQNLGGGGRPCLCGGASSRYNTVTARSSMGQELSETLGSTVNQIHICVQGEGTCLRHKGIITPVLKMENARTFVTFYGIRYHWL